MMMIIIIHSDDDDDDAELLIFESADPPALLTLSISRWLWRERSQGYKMTFEARFDGLFTSKIYWAGTVLIE